MKKLVIIIISEKNSDHYQSSDDAFIFDKKIYSDHAGKTGHNYESSSDLIIKASKAIISGRNMDNVMDLVKLDQLIYAGSHGFRIFGPNNLYMENEKAKTMLDQINEIEKKLRKKLENKIKGIKVERKQYAIAVHYRNSPEDKIDKAINIVDQTISEYNGFKKGEGKKIVEVRPDLN